MKIGLIICGIGVLVSIFICMLRKIKISPKDKSHKRTEEKNSNYKTLSPNDNITIKAKDALDFAIKKSDKAYNIALTGAYSSGKSSIIQSYFKENVQENEFTIISLATFFDKHEDESEDEKANRTNINNIEKIIIEKLYYSTFNKIKKKKTIDNIVYTFLIICLLIYAILYKIEWENIVNLYNNKDIFHIILYTIVIVSIILIIGFGIYIIIKNLSLSNKIKFKLDNAEFELEQKKLNDNNQSLINEEISFIVDIMCIAKYKYVIFEDIDRLNKPVIFERLRDLNLTLNSTLDKKVKFIYAVKDDTLIAEDRTKFFDFIFPVIPYTSYYNSSDEFYRIVKDEYNLLDDFDDNFILDICLFVSDIRILNNTMNEYIIYKKTLNKKIENKAENQKLFSILLYKNVCSDDFSKLQDNTGMMYNILTSRDSLVEQRSLKLKNEINKKNDEIKEYTNFIIDNNDFAELIYKRFYNYDSRVLIKENNSIKTISNAKEIKIDYIINPNITWYYASHYRDLESILNDNFPELYNIYLKIVGNYNNKGKTIQEEIVVLNNNIKQIERLELAELLNDSEIMKNTNFGKYDNLVKYLLLNSYIDETYNIFINIFHEGSITQNDENFLYNAKNRIKQQWNYYIEKLSVISDRLNILDIKNSKITNIFLLDYLLDNKITSKFDLIINNIINSDNFEEIIKEYWNDKRLKNIDLFMQRLCAKDKKIWIKLKAKIKEKNILDSLIKLILMNADKRIIEKIEEYNDLVKYIEDNNILLDENLERIKDIIIPFKYTNVSSISKEKKQFLLENRLYKINVDNIVAILEFLEYSDEKIKYYNYQIIQKENCIKLYIDENIEEYVNNVLLKLEQQKDFIDTVINLLNNKKIAKDIKIQIIDKENFELSNITLIKENELWNYLFKESKATLNYNNLNMYYEIFKLDDTLIYVINNREIKTSEWNNININLKRDILLSENINDSKYFKVLKYLDIKINENDDFSQLNDKKISWLILRNKFEYSSDLAYSIMLKSSNLFTSYVRKNQDSIVKDIFNGNIVFEIKDIQNILDNCNSKVSNDFIIAIINLIELKDITVNLAITIASILLKRNLKNILTEDILLKIISIIDTESDKVQLININFSVISPQNISKFLKMLNNNYVNLIINGTMPKFAKNDYNFELINNLKGLGYNIEFENISDKEIRIKKKNRK